MTGYQSKKDMAQDKLEQAAFDAWWDTQPRLNETNPCSVDSFEYWAWEGWHAALAQPAQEPWPEEPFGHMAGGVQPPQRPWVDLTDEEIENIAAQTLFPVEFARAIEQLSKELNA